MRGSASRAAIARGVSLVRVADGDLVFVVVVEGLDLEGGQDSLLDPVRRVGEDPGGVGQLVTPVVLAIADLPHGAPSQLTFLPAFWLLAPGAVGLIGLTQAATGPADYARVGAALAAVMAIALGVLIGAALYRTAHTALPIPRPQ